MGEQENRRTDDNILDKLIKIAEDNLKAQNSYLHELTLIKNRFDLNDRDHSDVKTQLNSVASNTYDIINKMNKSSNEVIIHMLEKNEDCNTAFSYKFNATEEIIKALNDRVSMLSIMEEDIKSIKKTGESTEKSFSLIQKLLGAILILVMGVQIAAFAWNSIRNDAQMKNIKTMIQKK